MTSLKIGRRALGLAALAATPARAQSWPEKPIRLVVPFPPGGSTDVLARRIGEKLTVALGQPVLVENRPGAGGTTGADAVAKSAPDGHTLLMGVTGSNAIAVSLFRNLPYHPVRDFAPVTRVISAPLVLVAHPSMNVTDVAGYVAAAKAAPNAVTYGTPGNGTSMHLTGVMFANATGTQLTHVPYRGTAQMTTDLIAARLVSSFADMLVTMPLIRDGQLRALAVTSPQRHPMLPQVPTMQEAGLAGFSATSWQGVFAPAGTPAPVVERLHAEIAKIMTLPEVKDSFASQGFIVEAVGPAEFAPFVAAETAKWAEVVRAGNVSLD